MNSLFNLKLVVTDDLNQLEKIKDQFAFFENEDKDVVVKLFDDINDQFFYKNTIFIYDEIYIFSFNKKIEFKIPFIFGLVEPINEMKEYLTQAKFSLDHYKVKEKILDGKRVYELFLFLQSKKISTLAKKLNKQLAIVNVGDGYASSVYIKNKIDLFENRLGIKTKVVKLDKKTINEKQMLEVINQLNNDDSIIGILVQLPILSDEYINHLNILNAVDPNKDIDCFTNFNQGLVLQDEINDLYPCTPKGILFLMAQYDIDISGKNVVILGRSNIVGKPLAVMMLNANSTVTVCHSHTKNIKEHTKKADILISAVGKAKFINESYIKKDAICIDVGINRDENNHICGDIDFDSVYDKVKYISPVPYGIGPMTLIMLLDNFYILLENYEKKHQIDKTLN